MRKLVLLLSLMVLTAQLTVVNPSAGTRSTSHLICKKVPAPGWWWAEAAVAEPEVEDEEHDDEKLPRAVASPYLYALPYCWQTAQHHVHIAEPLPAAWLVRPPVCSTPLLLQHRGLRI
jgi:hypothetical protein